PTLAKKMRLGALIFFSLVLYLALGGDSTAGNGRVLEEIISRGTFEVFLPKRNDNRCPATGFYTYDAFIEAAKAFPEFGNTGNEAMRKKEIAAFFGQTSHETNGGWPGADGGQFSWGYCFIKEVNPSPSVGQYYGRGPIQLTWDYNYRQCGDDIGVDLLGNPNLLSTNPVLSFKSAIWFWMKTQPPKPSCHDVITDIWRPSEADKAAGRLPGYGMTTHIINGGIECGRGPNQSVENRIGYFK
ncbi:glycoside hydrolase family 19 protein, partial [Klebsiella pneumoniae]|uniref:glycoside hydrolase family 19 protein n=1 Tax=Klebsiella pneumoniae TaxID=573 RepID=UPI0037C00F37